MIIRLHYKSDYVLQYKNAISYNVSTRYINIFWNENGVVEQTSIAVDRVDKIETLFN